jgi:hypothetical protein
VDDTAKSGQSLSAASRTRPLTVLAWVIVALHVVGLVFAAVGMRPGTPLVSLAERRAYLAQAPAGWVLGWAVWMLCVPALVAFVAGVAQRLPDRAGLARLAVTLVVVGGAFDLCCDAFYILLFPGLAAGPLDETLFLLIERATGIVSLLIANGLYSLGTLLLALALRRQPGVGPLTAGLGYTVAGCGLVLAAAGFTGVAWHAEWATGPTIGLLCVWVVLVARTWSRP